MAQTVDLRQAPVVGVELVVQDKAPQVPQVLQTFLVAAAVLMEIQQQPGPVEPEVLQAVVVEVAAQPMDLIQAQAEQAAQVLSVSIHGR
jgi:hypothetical protein